MRFPSLILAAGRSERMGFPKLLLARQGRLLIEQMIDMLKTAGWQSTGIVVSDKQLTGFISDMLPDVDIIFNPQPERGMISSIRLGLDRAGDDAEGLLTWPVDHPLVTLKTLELIRAAADFDRVVVPAHQHRRGHPTWWGRSSWQLLQDSAADYGANAILKTTGVKVLEIPVDDEGVLVNINTPEDAVRHLCIRYQIEND